MPQIVTSHWGFRWGFQKRSGGFVGGLAVQLWQAFHRFAYVEVFRVRVGAHRELKVRVPDRGLGGSRAGSRRREHRGERRAERMKVYRPLAFVPLGDTGCFEVTVENPKEPIGHAQKKRGRGQLLRVDPTSQFFGQVGAERDFRADAVLLILGFELDQLRTGGEIDLGYGQGSEFVQAESGQKQRPVDEDTFPADGFELEDGFRTEFRFE